MAEFSFRQRLIHKISKKIDVKLAPFRRAKLNNVDFTIISNNCWGGICYEYFGLPKKSPTVGTYFMAEDYVKFVSRLEYYLGLNIKIISAEESKYAKELYDKGQEDALVGVLDDVEVVFLHYKTPEVAKAKWDKRVKRVNKENLIVKFSYMNNCTDELVARFMELPYEKKIMFVAKPMHKIKGTIEVPGVNGEVVNDTFYWNKYLNVIDFLNQKRENV